MILAVPEEEPPRMIRVVLQDGTRVSGDVVKLEDGILAITVPEIREPLRFPVAELRGWWCCGVRRGKEKAGESLALLFDFSLDRYLLRRQGTLAWLGAGGTHEPSPFPVGCTHPTNAHKCPRC